MDLEGGRLSEEDRPWVSPQPERETERKWDQERGVCGLKWIRPLTLQKPPELKWHHSLCFDLSLSLSASASIQIHWSQKSKLNEGFLLGFFPWSFSRSHFSEAWADSEFQFSVPEVLPHSALKQKLFISQLCAEHRVLYPMQNGVSSEMDLDSHCVY